MEKDIVSIQIFKNWLGGYKFSYYWQIFVNGEHWTTSKHGFSSEKSARFHGVVTLMAFDGFYSKWTLSE
jgi:hypothetical protein